MSTQSNDLKIHFLSVGEGDCTIVELPDGEFMMVDIRNARNDSTHNPDFENPIRYLQQITSSSQIYRYIQTHPDMDHLDGFNDLIQNYQIMNFWDTKNTKPKPDDFSMGYREEDWNSYRNNTKGKELHLNRTTSTIVSNLGPYIYNIYPISPTVDIVQNANSGEKWNELSYIVLLEYQGFKLLLGGDATTEIWSDIGTWMERNETAKRLLSNITVFKTSHHGRKSGYCGNKLLNLMNPQQIISDESVDAEESAHENYRYFVDNSRGKGLFSIERDTIIAHYHDIQNGNYSIDYKN